MRSIVNDFLPALRRRALPTGGILMALAFGCASGTVLAADPWLVVEGTAGPGQGKRIVLVSGDEEYRSEESLPQVAKILARHHGFHCTVLFAINPDDGTIDPNRSDHIPGLEALRTADLMVIFTRFRDLPDAQMREIVQYVDSGRPIVGLRTATHAFQLKSSATYQRYDWQSPEQGFGRLILGETWINHHGHHGTQSTRGVLVPEQKAHPILRGLRDGDIWGPTDVYGVRLPLPADCQPLVLGQVLKGMKSTDEPVPGKVNAPLMPIAWTKTYQSSSGQVGRVFTTTMGASQDLASAGLRRLLVNACYWALGMEAKITDATHVELVGDYRPTPFRFGGFQRGVRPADLAP